MKRVVIVVFFMLIVHSLSKAQKPSLRLDNLGGWPALSTPIISNDGRYVTYSTRVSNKSTLFLEYLLQNKELSFPDGRGGRFSQDSRKYLFMRRDTLFIFSMKDSSIQIEAGVNFFTLFDRAQGGDWLLYRKIENKTDLFIANLQTSEMRKFVSVKSFSVSKDGKTAILQVAENGQNLIRLDWVNLETDAQKTIWAGAELKDLTFDVANQNFVFIGMDSSNKERKGDIFYFDGNLGRVISLKNQYLAQMDSGFVVDHIREISPNGKKLVFTMQYPVDNSRKYKAGIVDVWSYKDPILQSLQLTRQSNDRSIIYAMSINDNNRKIILLGKNNDGVVFPASEPDSGAESILVLNRGEGDGNNEWNWNKSAQSSYSLVSLKDASKKLLDTRSGIGYNYSPTGKYLIYYDPDKKDYYSYVAATGVRNNVTHGVPTIWTSEYRDDEPISKLLAYGISGFIGDSEALIYDQNDLYKVDLSGKLLPVNLTNEYGKRHHLVFRITKVPTNKIIEPNENLLLSVFDLEKKREGFCWIRCNEQKDPEVTSLQPYIFRGPPETTNVNPVEPIKARSSDMYIVRRMSASEFPNYFYTKDFRQYTPITKLFPEKEYNWLTTELVNWRTMDGRSSQGVLYKPENFDPHKKYPMIIYYYERFSEALNAYIEPETSVGTLNIPFFVSNGYLVFVPDIHYTIGSPGRSAYNTVVSVAKYLSKRAYIDSSKIGIQGHSFGGFETNYIITHSNLFAAAMSGAGMSNFISIYGSIMGDGSSRQRQYELYRDRMGATLWQIPEKYIENSPVLHVDRVTTPLLMMANKQDGDVPFQQGVELFTALRRLGKKAWMLQYDGQGHIVSGDAAADLTRRMFQFFNYYLKDELPPKWMTEGIPARLKGIETGFDLDASGKKP